MRRSFDRDATPSRRHSESAIRHTRPTRIQVFGLGSGSGPEPCRKHPLSVLSTARNRLTCPNSRGCRVWIDDLLGKIRELLVRALLLFESRKQGAKVLIQTELPCPGGKRAVD